MEVNVKMVMPFWRNKGMIIFSNNEIALHSIQKEAFIKLNQNCTQIGASHELSGDHPHILQGLARCLFLVVSEL